MGGVGTAGKGSLRSLLLRPSAGKRRKRKKRKKRRLPRVLRPGGRRPDDHATSSSSFFEFFLLMVSSASGHRQTVDIPVVAQTRVLGMGFDCDSGGSCSTCCDVCLHRAQTAHWFQAATWQNARDKSCRRLSAVACSQLVLLVSLLAAIARLLATRQPHNAPTLHTAWTILQVTRAAPAAWIEIFESRMSLWEKNNNSNFRTTRTFLLRHQSNS